MNLETRLYALVLKLYPHAFQQRHGKAMLETYRDALHAAKLEGRAAGFHFRTALDLISSLIAIRLDDHRSHQWPQRSRLTAILATLLLIKFLASFVLNATVFQSPSLAWPSISYGLDYLLLTAFAVSAAQVTRAHRSGYLFLNGVALLAGLETLCLIFILGIAQVTNTDPYIYYHFPEAEHTSVWQIVFVYLTRGFPTLGFWLIASAGVLARSVEVRRLTRWTIVWFFYTALYVTGSILAAQVPGDHSQVQSLYRSLSSGFQLLLLIGVTLVYWQRSRAGSRSTSSTGA